MTYRPAHLCPRTRPENGSSGLMIYGLHNDLVSSDSEDTDYNPGDSILKGVLSPSSEDENEETDCDNVYRPGRLKRKKEISSESDSEEERQAEKKKPAKPRKPRKKRVPVKKEDGITEETPEKGNSSRKDNSTSPVAEENGESSKKEDGASEERAQNRQPIKKRRKKTAAQPKGKEKAEKMKKKKRSKGLLGMYYSDDSDDSDYYPESANLKENAVTRGQKMKEIQKENAFPKHDRPPADDTWSSLPTEILQILFSFVITLEKGVLCLCRCAQVSHHWYSVASQSISWQGTADLSFIGGNKKANDSIIEELTKTRLMEIKGLNLSGWVYLTKVGVASIADNCPMLEYINLSNCQKKVSKVSADSLVELAEKTNIKRVHFSNLRICAGSYSKSLVKFIIIRGIFLTHLNFSDNISLGSVILSTISEHCLNLEVLDLSNTSVRSVSFENLQHNCTKLEELYLANLILDVRQSRVRKKEENPGFPNLKVLSVAKNNTVGWFTDSLISDILRTSFNLQMLDIRGNRSITDVGLDIPSTRIERLFLSRGSISLRSIEKICDKWSDTLWDLDLSWSEAYGTQFDVLLNHMMTCVRPCTNIKNLNLAGTACTDIAVRCVLETCASLESLDLTSCRGITRGNKRVHTGEEAIETLRKSYNNIPSGETRWEYTDSSGSEL